MSRTKTWLGSGILDLYHLGTVPLIGLYEVKVGKLQEASNKNF